MTMSEILAAADVGELADARRRLGDPSEADFADAQGVIDSWDDEQAVSNLLLHPDLLPVATRVPTIIRGLEDVGYVQLAAAVGSGSLPAPVAEEDRVALVDALLDLIAGQGGLAAQGAASSLAGLLRPVDATKLVVLLGHPEDLVRRDLQAAAIQLLGAAGLDLLLDDRDQVRPDDAEMVRAELAADGIDLSSAEPLPLSAPAMVPNRRDYSD